jgi:hypothetical protein
MRISCIKTSEERLKECGWEFSHFDIFEDKVYSKKIKTVNVTITLNDDGDVYVDRKILTPNSLVVIGTELKKLEVNNNEPM